MPEQIKTFEFLPGHILRVIERDGEPWFVAKDVCAALDLTDTGMAVKGLHADDKVQQSLGLRGQAPWLVNESGLYALVMRSNKQSARDFQRWVTGTVLPAIRKDGAYIKGEEHAKSDDDLIALGMAAMQRKIARLAHQEGATTPALPYTRRPSQMSATPTLEKLRPV
ncbi:BRO family protein [uncultured Pseudacidovorax sp.]|uniref:BRO-N domain-containing protein n=1 Tax=uncultured Pseudacidovorax sp. TaxID=679313 RepID=UPI0025F4C56E|nr:BRO family protein [uncultured Pseudacidovorax sp.]